MRTVLTITGLVALAVAAPASAGMGEEAGSPVSVGVNPWWVAAADFNGDGRPDLAVANDDSAALSGTVSILLRQPTGGFLAEGAPLAAGNRPDSVATGDFDDDGRTDLAVANYVSNTVSVFLRKTDNSGFVEEGTALAVGTSPHAVSVGDFNGDGRDDIATASHALSTVTVLLRNAGNTGFAEEAGSPITVGTNPTQIAVADYDGDTRLDMAVANRGTDDVTVLLRKTDNTGFTAEATAPAVGDAPVGIAAGDFDGDGRPDLAVANEAGDSVSVLLRQAGGGFAAAPGSPHAAGDGAYGVAVGDFDGDARPDLAVTAYLGDSVSILHGAAGGAFAPAPFSPIAAYHGPLVPAAADFDADGRSDLAIPRFAANAVAVRLSRADPAAPAAPTAPVGCAPPSNGRIALWRGENGAASSGTGPTATLENGAGYRAGIVDQAFSLAGSDNYLHVPPRPELDLTDDLTLDAWVRLDDETFGSPDPYGVGGDRMLFWKTDQKGTGVATYLFWIEGDAPVTAQSAPLRFAAGAEYGTSFVESQALAWLEDTWYHVTATRSGDTVTLYRDGQQVGSGTIAQAAVSIAESPLALGAAPELDTIFSPIAGALDEVSVWDRSLGAEEVTELHETVTGACFDPPDLEPTPSPAPTTEPTPEPPTAEPPVARFLAPSALSSFREAVFDGGSSTQAISWNWDIDGNGSTDVDCGNQPQMQMDLGAMSALADATVGSTSTMKLSIGSLGGQTSTTQQPISVASPLAPPQSKYAGAALCFGNPSVVDLTEGNGPLPGCNEVLTFGLIRATGCFDSSKANQLKPQIQNIVGTAAANELKNEPAFGAYLDGAAAAGVISKPAISALKQPDNFDGGTVAPTNLGWAAAIDFHTTKLPVRVNGLDLYPQGGSEITFVPALSAILAPKVKVQFGSAVATSGSLALDVTESNGRVRVADQFYLTNDMSIGTFPLMHLRDVDFVRGGKSELTLGMRAAWFDYAGESSYAVGVPYEQGDPEYQGQPIIEGRATIDNASGPVIGAVNAVSKEEIGWRSWWLAPLVTDPAGVRFAYRRADGWDVDANLVTGTGRIPTGIFPGIKITKDDAVQSRVFKPASESAPEIAVPGMRLEEIDAGFATGNEKERPLLGTGRVRIGNLTACCALRVRPVGIDVASSVRLPGYAFDNTSLFAPPKSIYYNDVPRFELEGVMNIDGLAQISGFVQGRQLRGSENVHLRGEIEYESGRQFDLKTKGLHKVCITDRCTTAAPNDQGVTAVGSGAELTREGAFVCLKRRDSDIVLYAPHVQDAVVKPMAIPASDNDCDVPKLNMQAFAAQSARVSGVRARAVQAARGYVTSVAAGVRGRAIDISGAEAAPSIRVTAPDGTMLESPQGTGMVERGRMWILRWEAGKRTVVGLDRPAAGDYRIAPIDGSARWTRVGRADTPPPLQVSGKVVGRESKRTLTYSVTKRPGQRVTLVDQRVPAPSGSGEGERVLGRIRGSTGTVRVPVAPGTGKHRIVARVTLDGVQQFTEHVVATYTAPKVRVGRVTRIKVRRTRAGLTVTWRARKAAQRYAVLARTRTGASTFVTVRGRRAVLRGIAAIESGTVWIRGLGAGGERGRPARAKFAASAKPRSRIVPLRTFGRRSR